MDEIKNTFVVAHNVKMFNTYCRIIKQLLSIETNNDQEQSTEQHIAWYNNTITTPVTTNNKVTMPLIPPDLQKKLKKIEGKSFDFESLKSNKYFKEDKIICALNDLVLLLISRKSKEVNSLQREQQEATDKMSQLEASKARQLQEIMASLAVEKKAATDELKKQMKEQCEKEKQLLKEQLNAKEEQLKEKDKVITDKEKELEEKEDNLVKEVKRIEESKHDLQQQVDRLKEDINSINLSMQSEIQTKNAYQNRLLAKENELNAERSNNRSELEGKTREIEQMKINLEKELKEKEQLKETCKEEKENLEATFKNEKEILNQNIKKLSEAKEKLQNDYNQTKQRLSKLNKSEQEEAKLRVQLEQELIKKNKLEDELKNLKNDKEQQLNELESQLNDEKNALKELRLKYAAFNKYDIDKLKQIARDLDDMSLIRDEQIIEFLKQIGLIKTLKKGPESTLGFTTKIRNALNEHKKTNKNLETLLKNFSEKVLKFNDIKDLISDVKVDKDSTITPGALS